MHGGAHDPTPHVCQLWPWYRTGRGEKDLLGWAHPPWQTHVNQDHDELVKTLCQSAKAHVTLATALEASQESDESAYCVITAIFPSDPPMQCQTAVALLRKGRA